MDMSASIEASLTETILVYKPLIETALAYADHSHSFDHIVAMVLTNKLKLYPLDNSFILMEIVQSPNWGSYHCFLAGGVLSELVAAQRQIAEDGHKLGAKKLTFTGRRGFGKALASVGWKETHIHMSYPL